MSEVQVDLPKLPAWARVLAADERYAIVIEGDTDRYVSEWLQLLKVKAPDQYWLEVAYQCAKLDLQLAIEGTEFDPRTLNKPALFKFTRSSKYALAQHPAGKGSAAATKGREAREHYKRVRGRLPF